VNAEGLLPRSFQQGAEGAEAVLSSATCLSPFQHEKLKQRDVVLDRPPPFFIVVHHVIGVARAPGVLSYPLAPASWYARHAVHIGGSIEMRVLIVSLRVSVLGAPFDKRTVTMQGGDRSVIQMAHAPHSGRLNSVEFKRYIFV
jgi:hypothetical protein